MTALHQQVRRTIRRHALLPPGTRVLVGLSGGSDSVALFFLLQQIAARGACQLSGLAHLHHHIRGAAAKVATTI